MSYSASISSRSNSFVADLRSDTVTCPDPGMRGAIESARLGDDVYGEDPTVRALEERLAGRLGFDAGLFFPTGTQSNLTALLSHCQRGDEAVASANSHIINYEGAGASVLGGIALKPVPVAPDGGPCADAIEDMVNPDDPHFPRTRLLCLENTIEGRAVPVSSQQNLIATARMNGLAVHLDGARLFNAAIALGEEAADVARGVDTVSVCFSKGLGAPAGTVLCGNRQLISSARRWRKILGGGMRQSGVLAAAGLYALEHNVDRLSEDHRRASVLREALAKLPGAEVADVPNQTNMVWLTLPERISKDLAVALADRDIAVRSGPRMRLVLHRDVDDAALEKVISAFSEILPRFAAEQKVAGAKGLSLVPE